MMSNLDRLVYMANQIARNLETEGADQAAADTAEHIRAFWDPRMRGLILDHLAKGGEGLSAIARDAITRLARVTAH